VRDRREALLRACAQCAVSAPRGRATRPAQSASGNAGAVCDTEGRGADVGIEAVGTPQALDMAIRLTRRAGRLAVIGVHGQACEVHMGLLWNKSLTVTTGLSNVLAHFDDVLALLAAGELDPGPLVQRHMKLSEAEEAYAAYDRREALKIVLIPGA